MLHGRHLLAALTVIAALSLGSIASAMDKRPFDQKAFDAALRKIGETEFIRRHQC